MRLPRFAISKPRNDKTRICMNTKDVGINEGGHWSLVVGI